MLGRILCKGSARGDHCLEGEAQPSYPPPVVPPSPRATRLALVTPPTHEQWPHWWLRDGGNNGGAFAVTWFHIGWPGGSFRLAAAMQSADLDRAVAETVGKLRKQLFVKNAQGVSELWNSFSVADADGSGALDRDEFNEALHHAGVFLTTQEIGSVFRKFDANGNGVLEYEEFVNAVVPPLEGERLRLVKLAFARVDESGRGIVSADSLRQAYRADKHPRVESGELSEDAVADQVLGGLPDGEVSEVRRRRRHSPPPHTFQP